MFKKIFIFNCICAFILFYSSLLLSGCCSTRNDTNGIILSHQQQIDRLEEELRNRDRTVEAAVRELSIITSRSSEMEGTVDELIQLFGEYQRRVEQLLYDYNQIRTKTQDANENNNSTSVYLDYSHYLYDYRLYPILQRNQVATLAGYSSLSEVINETK